MCFGVGVKSLDRNISFCLADQRIWVKWERGGSEYIELMEARGPEYRLW